MWKRKISIKEQYGTLEHFLKGDEPCHYIGQRYIEGTNFYARREWRGVKDTAFAFYKWLCTWVKMAIFVMHDPVRIAKAFWKYRWLSAYLAAPMMVDKWIEGDRGEALRADLYALDCMISDSTDTLWKSLRADRRLGETKWSDVTVAFDYTLPKHIIFGFPGYYAINMQQHAAFMLPLMRKQLGCYYVDQAVACGIPGDMCTLPLVEVGVAVENEYPDIGNCWLTTNNPCDANMMDNTAMWRALSNDGKKAVHPFTTPLMYDDPTTKELGVHEVYSAIEFLEQQFGVPFNWDTFIEHIEDTNEFNRGSLNRWDIYAKSDNGALNSVVQGLFRLLQLALQLGDAAVANLGGLHQIAFAGCALLFGLRGFEVGFERLDVLDDVLFVLPFGLALRQCILSVGDFLAQMLKAFAADLVRLLHKRLLLDLHLGELALRQIDLFGHAVDLDAQTAGCLVHEVDGLVGQETIGDVAVR